ncbi:MAG: NAD(P)/FAD-dependent oxidoreductase [Clostridia bacterium]|nr:NAD(P)/FAD-dependent oxidoreductase [Clostridium sp.]MBS6252589.1 NAD(P)/FAD-dependent oxidoreductase [Clostridium sp.]
MFDVIIIGAGPAGISASIYTKRANLKTMIIYQNNSNLEKAELIENYYGFAKGITGIDLYNEGIKQAENLGVELKEEEVINIKMNENGFEVITDKNEYKTKNIVLATGNKKNIPKIKGIQEFEGRGISYCAVCDGFFYRNKDIVVIGNGKYAIAETNELINLANQIIILTDGEKAPEFRADNVKIDTRKIEEIQGEKKVEQIKLEDNTIIKTDGIFVAKGVAGSNEFAKKLGIITNKDKIVVNEKMETNIPGIYACGDCTGGILQISKAVYEGTKAGLEVIKRVKQNG